MKLRLGALAVLLTALMWDSHSASLTFQRAAAGPAFSLQDASFPAAPPKQVKHRRRVRHRVYELQRIPTAPTEQRGPGGAVGYNGGPIDWYAIAACESGLRWDYNGPSGYDGGLQFSPATWISAGGSQYAPYAYLATAAEQIATAEAWVDLIGCVACSAGWPVCGKLA